MMTKLVVRWKFQFQSLVFQLQCCCCRLEKLHRVAGVICWRPSHFPGIGDYSTNGDRDPRPYLFLPTCQVLPEIGWSGLACSPAPYSKNRFCSSRKRSSPFIPEAFPLSWLKPFAVLWVLRWLLWKQFLPLQRPGVVHPIAISHIQAFFLLHSKSCRWCPWCFSKSWEASPASHNGPHSRRGGSSISAIHLLPLKLGCSQV